MQQKPVIYFESQAEWESWLEAHHAESDGVWIKFAKKDSGIMSVSYPEAIEGALCYGWIDGQAVRFDEQYWLQRFTPRRAKSKWSKINCAKAEALIVQGRMKPAGLKEVERARADGRWDAAYASPRNMAVPDDLRQRLDEHPDARAFFEGLNSRNRYAILYRIEEAKRPETRTRRIEKFVAMLKAGETIY
jgi:uncharacterized protein YdeI (YjbR/CyaY-like superfamily)